MAKVLKMTVVALMVLLLIAGCSNSNDTNTGDNGQSQNAGKETTDTTNGTTDDPTAQIDSIVYAHSVPITFLDTAGSQPQGYPSGYEAAFAIYNGLVKFDEDLNFQPDLATDWSVGDDGKTWIFHLRQGVKFHDGTDFNADAVVYDYARMLDKERNIAAYSALWVNIDKVVKVDDYTVEVVTKEPYGGLLNVMAHGSALLPSPAAIEKYGADIHLHPVGTGPYMMDKFNPGTELILKANDNYFGKKPQYKEMTFRYVADASSRIAALKSGQADVIDAVPSASVADLKNDSKIEVITKPGLQVFGIGLNQTNPILQDQKVRQALNYAIQKAAIVKALFNENGSVLTSPLAPNTTGYAKSGEYAFDIDKSKKMLEEAGWVAGSDGILAKNGNKMSFTLRAPEGAYPNDVAVAETIQSQLKTIGVDVKINKVDTASFWNGLKIAKDKVDFDMVLFGYNPSHGDGYIQLDALYRTNPDEGQAPPQWNFNWYSNKQVDSLLDQAKTQVDMKERTNTLGQAEKVIWDDAPYIYLYTNTIITAKIKDVTGIQVLPVVFTLLTEK
jgi:ABC-type transport system substrate-binding protein